MESDYIVNKVEGKNRVKTANAIAQKYFGDSNKAIVVNGYGLPDALVGGYLGAKFDAPIVLTANSIMSYPSIEYLKKKVDKTWYLVKREQ